MRSYRLDTGEVTLSVSERGDGPALVVAHGIGSTGEFAARCWGGVEGYRLVTYDLRGHGRSTPLADPRDHTIEAHARDLAALCEATRARVVGGISLGAHVAARHALTHPADALLLAIPGALDGQRHSAAAADEIERDGVERTLHRIARDADRWVAIELERSWPRHDRTSLVAALRAIAEERPFDVGTIEAPTGIVGLVDDPAHPFAAAEDYARAIPRASLQALTLAEWGESRRALGDAAMAACRTAIASR